MKMRKVATMNPTLNFALDVKALSDREFEGHGSIFGNVDLDGDVVLPGAFKGSLAAHGRAGTLPAMFWMHRPDQVAGVWTTMKEDGKGLYVRGTLADTPLGNEMRTLLAMKAVRGLSIGYKVIDGDYDRDGNRLLREIDLWEVSLVSLACNPLARIEGSKARLSDAGEYVPTEREFEKSLRDAGFSRNVARHVCAKVFDAEADSGMLSTPRRWDAGTVENDDDEAELLKSLHRFTDKVGAAALSL
jgi:uncharacterized protein